jgi:hypothetical protein
MHIMEFVGSLGGKRHRVEFGLVDGNRPGDASQLVGKSDGRLVVATRLLDL